MSNTLFAFYAGCINNSQSISCVRLLWSATEKCWKRRENKTAKKSYPHEVTTANIGKIGVLEILYLLKLQQIEISWKESLLNPCCFCEVFASVSTDNEVYCHCFLFSEIQSGMSVAFQQIYSVVLIVFGLSNDAQLLLQRLLIPWRWFEKLQNFVGDNDC